MRTERTRRVGRCYRWGMWGCAALTLAAGSASGQQSQDPWNQDQMGRQDQGQQDQYRQPDQNQKQDQMQSGQSSQMVPQLRNFDLVQLEKEQDNRQIQVIIAKGRIVAAHVDGRQVPAQNVRVQGNSIRITDQNNQTTQIRIPQATAMTQSPRQFGTTEPYGRSGSDQGQYKPDQYKQDQYKQDQYKQDQYKQDQYKQDQYRSVQGDSWHHQASGQTSRQVGQTAGYEYIGNTLGFTASQASSSDLSGARTGDRFEGIRVDRVFNNGPADNAGLQSGDLIIAVNNHTPANVNTFNRTVNQLSTNEPLRFTIIRNDTLRTITMRLTEKDLRELKQGQTGGRIYGTTGGVDPGRGTMLGIQVTEADSRELQTARVGDRYNQGILVEQVQQGSLAERQGLRQGDIIVAVDGRTPATPDMLQQRLSQKARGDTLQLDVIRNGEARDVNIRFDGQSGMDRGTDYGVDRGYDSEFRRDMHDEDLEADDHRLDPNKVETYRPSEDASGKPRRTRP